MAAAVYWLTEKANFKLIILQVTKPKQTKKSHKDRVHWNVRMANSLRGEVIKLYKNLLYLGREYPKGADYFRSRLKAAFLKNKDETDPEKIKQLIARGEFVMKELEALYFLRKYRAMKQRYYSDDKPWLCL